MKIRLDIHPGIWYLTPQRTLNPTQYWYTHRESRGELYESTLYRFLCFSLGVDKKIKV